MCLDYNESPVSGSEVFYHEDWEQFPWTKMKLVKTETGCYQASAFEKNDQDTQCRNTVGNMKYPQCLLCFVLLW